MPSSPSLSLQIRPETVAEGFTQSELSMLDECALKWNFRYNNLLTRDGCFNWDQFVGTSWHGFQECWRTMDSATPDLSYLAEIPTGTPRDTDFEMQLEYWTKVLPAYQLAYTKCFGDERSWNAFIVEKELSAELLGYKIRGQIDLAIESPKIIRDFKTTVSSWLISPTGWHFKLQFMTYCWLMMKNYPDFVKGGFDFQMDILQKPALKQTKADGTWQGHIRRVCQDIQERPEFYLKRETKRILPDQIKRFETNVLIPKITRLSLAVDNPEDAVSIVSNPNTNACNSFGKQCEFFEICESSWDSGKFFFVNRKTKHEELAK